MGFHHVALKDKVWVVMDLVHPSDAEHSCFEHLTSEQHCLEHPRSTSWCPGTCFLLGLYLGDKLLNHPDMLIFSFNETAK